MALSTLREQQSSEKKSFLWKIPNFAEMRNSEEVVNAQEVTFEMGGEMIGMRTRWKGFLRRKEDGDIGVYVKLLDYPKHLTAVHAHLLIKIKRHDFTRDLDCGMHCNNCPYKWDMNKNMMDGGAQGCDNFVLKSWNTKDFIDGGIPYLTITITLFNLENVQLATLLGEYQEKLVDQHYEILAKVRNNPPDSTVNHRVTIVSKDGKKLVGDAGILAERSPVFRAMLQGNMTEAETGVVKVEDIGSAPLEVLLEFCRRGTLQENWKKAGVIEGLLYGAHKYMLEDLLEFLGKALLLVCTPDNCAKLMRLARAFEVKEAQVKLFEYFKQNMANNLEEVASFMEDATRAPEDFGKEGK